MNGINVALAAGKTNESLSQLVSTTLRDTPWRPQLHSVGNAAIIPYCAQVDLITCCARTRHA